jgi:hypothetical protein
MKFDTIEIRGIKIEIWVDSTGQFFADVDDERYAAPTLELLKKKLNDATRAKQKNVSIPFVYWYEGWDDEGRIVRGVATGIHVGNGNLLVKLKGDDRSEQLSNYRRDEAKFDPKHADELMSLWKAKKAASKAIETFTKAHSINLKDLVMKAIGEDEK